MSPADHSPRPWPAPRWPWVMAMQWHDLLFMHWPVPAAALRPLIPAALELETFDGSAWLGIVPFWMRGVRPRLTPSMPWVSAFPELNVRTYVRAEGKPGVWFFSLDAGSPLAVRVARAAFHLPYFDARMAALRAGDTVEYRSLRSHSGARPAALAARYRPTGPAAPAADGSLDAWLTERYCLYAANRRGLVWRGEIHHRRWPLQPAEVELRDNRMADQIGLRLPDTAPLLHFVERIDVRAWLVEPVGRRA